MIAISYDTTVDEIVRLNDIADPNLIRPGQELTVAGGGFVCPVPGATFFNDWGFPRSGGRFHEGNDMFAARGAKVLAPVSGRVDQVEGTIGGLPVPLVYVFAVWLGLIVGAALLARPLLDSEEPPPQDAAESDV